MDSKNSYFHTWEVPDGRTFTQLSYTSALTDRAELVEDLLEIVELLLVEVNPPRPVSASEEVFSSDL